MPPNAAFQTLLGPACKNSALSKQLVCLEACKKLHQLGALNDHLLPSTDKPLVNDINGKGREPASGAGMYLKRKKIISQIKVNFFLDKYLVAICFLFIDLVHI